MASSILKYAIVIMFMFSTVYTLGFYFYEAGGQSIDANGLEELDGQAGGITAPEGGYLTSTVTDVFDWLLEAMSWFSPFVILKGLLWAVVPEALYQPLNLVLLRPLGWIGTWITTEWVINKIRGSSEG